MDSGSIIYDGSCGFCNKIILYLAKKDTSNNFIFVSNLSHKGKEFLQENNLIETTKTTIILVVENQFFVKGKAIKMIFEQLAIHPALMILVKITNLKILDFFYSVIANNRLLLSKNNCKIPSKEIMSKFIIS